VTDPYRSSGCKNRPDPFSGWTSYKTTKAGFRFLWSPYGIGQTIIFSSCGFFFLLLFSSPNRSYRQYGYLPYFHTWCGLSTNLRCRSETCCMWLAENTGRKKVAKNRHLGNIAQLRRAISSQLRHISTIRKKLVKQQMPAICPPDVPTIWWTSAHQWLRSVWEFEAPLRISTGFASWQRYCMVFQQWASTKVCDVEQRAPSIFGRATITLDIGRYSSYVYFMLYL